MLRRLTKQVGRFRAGVVHDWPLSTWMQIGREINQKIDDFSTPEEMNQVLMRRPKGGVKSAARGT